MYINNYTDTEECKNEILDWARKNPSIALVLYRTYINKHSLKAKYDEIVKPNGDTEDYVVGISGNDGSKIYCLGHEMLTEINKLLCSISEKDFADNIISYLIDKVDNEDLCNWGFGESHIELLGKSFSPFSYKVKHYEDNLGYTDVYVLNNEYPKLLHTISEVVVNNIHTICVNLEFEKDPNFFKKE